MHTFCTKMAGCEVHYLNDRAHRPRGKWMHNRASGIPSTFSPSLSALILLVSLSFSFSLSAPILLVSLSLSLSLSFSLSLYFPLQCVSDHKGPVANGSRSLFGLNLRPLGIYLNPSLWHRLSFCFEPLACYWENHMRYFFSPSPPPLPAIFLLAKK